MSLKRTLSSGRNGDEKADKMLWTFSRSPSPVCKKEEEQDEDVMIIDVKKEKLKDVSCDPSFKLSKKVKKFKKKKESSSDDSSFSSSSDSSSSESDSDYSSDSETRKRRKHRAPKKHKKQMKSKKKAKRAEKKGSANLQQPASEDGWAVSKTCQKFAEVEEMIGPLPPRPDRFLADPSWYGSALMPGEGQAIADYVKAGKRIPRRGEIGLTSAEIEAFESLGYVMSGSRHKRMTAVRIRKENQVYSAEEKRALSLLNFEEKANKEKKLMADFRRYLLDKQQEAGLLIN